MKRIILFSLLIPILFLGSSVLAQNDGGDQVTETLEQETADLPSTLPRPGLTPDHPLYFLDIWGENIGLFFLSRKKGRESVFLCSGKAC